MPILTQLDYIRRCLFALEIEISQHLILLKMLPRFCFCLIYLRHLTSGIYIVLLDSIIKQLVVLDSTKDQQKKMEFSWRTEINWRKERQDFIG